MAVPKEELQQVLHLNLGALGDRVVNLMSLWDGEHRHSWLPVGDRVMKVQMVDVVEGPYLAKTAARHSDLLIPFVDLMWQRATWPEIVPLLTAICDDFRNVHRETKTHVQHPPDAPCRSGREFASTELEYLVILARTIFDLLQEMMAKIWHQRVRLNDPTAKVIRKRRKLPDTFSSLCLEEKRRVCTTAEIEARFALPKAMAEQCAAAAPFFWELHNVRDGVVHGARILVQSLKQSEASVLLRARLAPGEWTQFAQAGTMET
jgi:hypothetical protein